MEPLKRHDAFFCTNYCMFLYLLIKQLLFSSYSCSLKSESKRILKTTFRCLYWRISEIKDLGHSYIVTLSFRFRTIVVICRIFEDITYRICYKHLSSSVWKTNHLGKKKMCKFFSPSREYLHWRHWLHYLKSEIWAVVSFQGALRMDGKHFL